VATNKAIRATGPDLHGNSHIPILIDLSSMTGKIKNAISGRLRKFGEITNTDVINVFLATADSYCC
jgi:hypothetical protein